MGLAEFRMKTHLIALGIVICLVGIYTPYGILFWVGMMTSVAGAVWPAPKKKSSPKKEEDETILHPVIYEDVGDPPYLYPEKMKIAYKTKKSKPERTAAFIPKSIGAIAAGVYRMGKWILDEGDSS